MILVVKHRVLLKHLCLAFSRCPGGFRELREAGRNHYLHLSWYLSMLYLQVHIYIYTYIIHIDYYLENGYHMSWHRPLSRAI
jgi:hypothetical protein